MLVNIVEYLSTVWFQGHYTIVGSHGTSPLIINFIIILSHIRYSIVLWVLAFWSVPLKHLFLRALHLGLPKTKCCPIPFLLRFLEKNLSRKWHSQSIPSFDSWHISCLFYSRVYLLANPSQKLLVWIWHLFWLYLYF